MNPTGLLAVRMPSGAASELLSSLERIQSMCPPSLPTSVISIFPTRSEGKIEMRASGILGRSLNPWTRENAHGLKAEVRDGVFVVITPGIDLAGPWHPIPNASPDGVLTSIVSNQILPQGADYGKAVRAIQEAAELHARGEGLKANSDRDTAGDHWMLSDSRRAEESRATIAPLQAARTTDINTETGGMVAAYAEVFEDEEAEEEMG